MSKKGLFIVLEGTDGCGKTTHTETVRRFIASKTGRKCIVEREPDSRDIIGAIIRSALYGSVKILPESMAYLHVADRLEHIAYMTPLLEAGTDIVCDRYYISNMAYNAGDELSVEDIFELNGACRRKLQPDAVIFLEVSPEETARRRHADRSDEEIYDATEKQIRIRSNYYKALELTEKDGVRVFRIDASGSLDEVAKSIEQALETLF